MARVVVGQVSEIPPGTKKIVVPFRGRAGIGVFNVEGSFYAIRNICPHKRGPLCTGELSGRVQTIDPPSVNRQTPEVTGEGELLRCPWHQWPFEIQTGRCLINPDVYVRTYPVAVEGNYLVIEYEDEGPVYGPTKRPPD